MDPDFLLRSHTQAVAQLAIASTQVKERDARIAELEAELAKLRPPPQPDAVS